MEYKTAEQIRAYMAAIIESSDDAIIGKNLDGVITSWNASAQRIFGYKPEEAVGKHITLIIPKEREDEEFMILGKVKAGQRVEHFETVRRAKDGSPRNISLTVSPIRDTSGAIVGISKIARDVTAQKKTEQDLMDALKRRDEFLANMSHELRTPMNAIIGLSGILSMSPSLSAKEKQYVGTLKQSADHMMELINNLLDFSKVEAGSMPLEHVEFDFQEMVSGVARLMSFKAEEKGIALGYKYQTPVRKYFMGDSLRLKQVLTNLVANAIKFTEHGSVDINIRSEEKDGSSSFVVIDVIDTGIGIPVEKIDVIFEKFVQADASTTRKFGGSGLGLSISKAFVEKMDGAITVVSRQGLGSAFTIKVPLLHSQRDNIVGGFAENQPKVRKNVLIVDDYEPNILVMTAMLDMLGYSYDYAENGLDAVRKYQENNYNIILMDVQMPVMDGYESTRRIRQLEEEKELSRTAIIAMTAHALEHDRRKCMQAGMDEFLPKPFEISLLSNILKQNIENQ